MVFITGVEYGRLVHSFYVSPGHEDAKGYSPQSESDSGTSISKGQYTTTATSSASTKLQYINAPRLPLELHKEIIDWIAADVNLEDHFSWSQDTFLRFKDCSAAQLIRFINSFQSLSKACRLSKFSLTFLKIELRPGMSTVLDWFIKANSFVVHLKQLTVYFTNEKLDMSCEGIADLLKHCRNGLMELTLVIFGHEIIQILEHMSLSGLDKLSKLVYQVSKSDDILDLIIEQLQQVSSTNDIREVVFDFDWTVTVNISKWKDIDSLLVGDKFKRLHKVGAF
ncbi:hypothetical protein QCA50_019765 [Cerrena zonata]|uniref:Uncharacterized protein n=1 Tax=Cerrena zonata TaxID=2478898 RepID=A0AAW0FD46_9APHY